MEKIKLKLWENDIPYFRAETETPNSATFIPVECDEPQPCVVVLPGGGYKNHTAHEGVPIAEFYNSRGMHALVVDYRLDLNRYPAPLADAQRAIKLVRAHAAEWKVDPDKIVTIGFSAGGHLSASCGVLEDVSKIGDEYDEISARPNGFMLGYAVISLGGEFGHVGSGLNLLGEGYKYVESYLSLENRVTEDTPPCFMWSTSDDSCVNVKNSLVFAEKLRDCGVKFEMHIYPSGYHGLGLALGEGYEDSRRWAEQSADWIRRSI